MDATDINNVFRKMENLGRGISTLIIFLSLPQTSIIYEVILWGLL